MCASNPPLNIVSYVFAGVSFKNLETFSLLDQPSSAVGAETPSFFVPQPPSVINKDDTTVKHLSFISGFYLFSCLANNLFVFLHSLEKICSNKRSRIVEGVQMKSC